MSHLRRMTRYGLAQLRSFVRETGRLPDGAEIEDGWTEEHPSGARVDELSRIVPSLSGADPESDPEDAIRIREALPLARRVAADGAIWPWLSACAFPEYTRRRWQSDDKALFLPRVDVDPRTNAFGRLWWGAENTRVDDASAVTAALGIEPTDDRHHFTRRALGQYGLHYALAGRDLFQSRTATVAFLALVARHDPTMEDVDELIKWFNLGLSTVVVEWFEPTDDEAGPYAVDPERCAALLAYLERLTQPYWEEKLLRAERAATEREASADADRRAGILRRAISFFRGGRRR